MLERVIEKRLGDNVAISEQQFGFMPRRSATGVIFDLRQLIEKYREEEKSLHLVFIDPQRAYDRVPTSEVWNRLSLN